MEQRPYAPSGAAFDFMRYKGPEQIMAGPAGTGKSRGGLEKLYACAVKYPKMRGLMVRKVRRTIRQSAMVTFEEKVLPALSPVYFHNGDSEYRFPNGSVIVVAGLDKASKVLSTEFDMAYVMQAEELREDDWEKITTRLRNWVMPYQQLMGDCNPEGPQHWIKKRADRGQLKMWNSRHEDNPALFSKVLPCDRCGATGYVDAGSAPELELIGPDGEYLYDTTGAHAGMVQCPQCKGKGKGRWTAQGAVYMAVLDRLTGVRFKRLRLGVWAAAEGMVFDQFDYDRNVIRPFPIPASWPRYRVIDFGYVHPFVCQWYAEDGDGRLYLYRELYGTHKLVEDWARDILSYDARENIAATICDHDAEDRATLEKYLKAATVPANKAVTAGIQATNARLRPAGDGKPRLMFFDDTLVDVDPNLEARKKPLCTIQEVEGYVWAQRPDGTYMKDVPVKEDDHGMDGVRYMVYWRDNPEGELLDDAAERFRQLINR